ncbi:MAG: RnfABCDGE type electron transport complex subunit D [Lachnospirales bacterium]
MSDKKFVVSSTPHIRSNDSIQSIMQDVAIALLPATLVGMYMFGLPAIFTIILAVGSSVLFEYLFQKYTKQPITINDYSAVVTGLLLALNLPPTVSPYIPIMGSFFAIIVAKQLFGGLGQNFINPALAGRAFLVASYPTEMTKWTAPVNNLVGGLDAVSTATPLSGGEYSLANAFIGNIGGCIGEVSALALLIGAAYLLIKKVISWRIPTIYIGTTFVLTLLLGHGTPYDAFSQIFLGGLIIGAFFMATDYSSSPVTAKGQVIFALGCGILTAIIRIYGGYPEGVSYSILLMNLTVPLIERYTRPSVFGVEKQKKVKEEAK